jgi:hypothetical protein
MSGTAHPCANTKVANCSDEYWVSTLTDTLEVKTAVRFTLRNNVSALAKLFGLVAYSLTIHG